MKKSFFSLVELLVVISIIAVLMGILIPTVSSMRERARITQAKAEINAIKTAILQYEATYGLLPVAAVAGTEQIELSETTNQAQYDMLMEWLTQTDCGADGLVDQTGNLRRIKLLDPKTAKSGSENIYYDPWSKNAATNKRYVILLDCNYNDKVTVGTETLNGKVFIYSLGPDRNDDKGKNKSNGGGKDTDDVNSWDK